MRRRSGPPKSRKVGQVSDSQVRLYYGNVLETKIGPEHGITDAQLDEMERETAPLIQWLNAERQAGRTAYRDLPYRPEIAESVRRVIDGIEIECENLVVLGIGGSALGNIALQTALNPCMYNLDPAQRTGQGPSRGTGILPVDRSTGILPVDPDSTQRNRPRLFVFDNVDPAQLASFFDWIGDKLDKTLFNVISKSGRTSETAAQFMVVRRMLLDRLGPDALRRHIVATTDANKGTLRTIADEAGMASLVVPDGVGGRFSVLSAVGLFSAAMCGIDIDDLLAGARAMDDRVKNQDFRRNPAAVNAAINVHYYRRGKRNSIIFPYSHRLKDMADWYRQLWAESLGKARGLDGRNVFIGPTPINALGTTDQHSQVQLYREGPNDKLFTFLEVKAFDRDLTIGPAPDCAPELGFLAGKRMSTLLNAEKKATEFAMLSDQRPCLTVFFDRVDAHAVGQFIYLFEVTTSLAGALFKINTYDQPAVELGKDATFALMGKEGRYTDQLTYPQWARQIDARMAVKDEYLL